MVGQSLGEQGEQKVINNNFMGFELGDPMKPGTQAYVKAWTSTIVDVDVYKKDPSKYKDWTVTYKNRNTISQQLDRGEKKIWCLTYKNRQAYKDVDSAATAFVNNVESKIRKCENSPKEEHRKLAAAALAGDVDAWVHMVELVDVSLHMYAYNGVAGYMQLAKAQIAKVRSDPALQHLD
jgi:putative IMPACT (imprinted ancient) family translation regulator